MLLRRLCLAFGCEDPEELAARHDSRWLTGWQAYEAIEGPIGSENRADLRIAYLSAMFANANRRSGSRSFKPADFMPYYKEIKKLSPPQTDEQQQEAAQMICKAYSKPSRSSKKPPKRRR